MAAIFFQGHPYIWRTTVHHDIRRLTVKDTHAHPAQKSKQSDSDEFTLDNTPIFLEDWEDWLESD